MSLASDADDLSRRRPAGLAYSPPLSQAPLGPSRLRLSARQREILGLVARGQGNKEIARALNISRRTVEAHLTELYYRTGVHRRAALVAWWLRQEGDPG